MSTYTRQGQFPGQNDQPEAQQVSADSEEIVEEKVKIDGFAQVVEMLEVADDDFRESLLKRIGARDPALAGRVRRQMGGRA